MINYSSGIRDVRYLFKTKVDSGHNQTHEKANTCAFPFIPTRAMESSLEGNEGNMEEIEGV